MVGLGFGVIVAGFSLAGYGWSQLRGCNASFVSLIWPGSYKGCNPDSGTTSATPAPVPAVLGPGSLKYLQQLHNPNENVKVRQNDVLGR